MALHLDRSLSGINDRPLSLQWLGDFPLIASAGQAKVIRIHHNKGALLQDLSGHTDRICCIKWLPGENKLASGSFDRTLKIWDVEAGTILRSFQSRKEVNALEWMGCANQLAAGSADLDIYDLRVNKRIANVRNLADPIASLKWSNERQSLASGSIGNSITLWDIVTRTPLQVLYGHTDFVRDLEWIDDRQILASSSRDGSFKLWDLLSSRSYYTKFFSYGGTFIANMVGLGRLVTAGTDRIIRQWTLSTMEISQELGSPKDQISALSWSAEEQMLAAACYCDVSLYSLEPSE